MESGPGGREIALETPGEALEIHFRPGKAAFWSLGITSYWYETIGYGCRESHLNSGTAVAEPDGSIRAVICHGPPPASSGIPNWVDPKGHVEGTMTLRANLVTIGEEGVVHATVNARVIDVEGSVTGDLNGEEQVIVRRSGRVNGNIAAPRVTLEDGCYFKGSIDMDVSSGSRSAAGKVADLKPGGPESGSKGSLDKTSGQLS